QRTRQEDRDAAATPALPADASTVHLDEPLGDAEPESRATVLPGDGRVDLAELGEDVLDLVLGDADSGVGPLEREPPVGEAHVDVDPPLARELERVPGEGQPALGGPPG